MYPFIILFGESVSLYAILALSGLLISGLFIFFLNKNRLLRHDQLLHISLVSIGGMFLGGHILFGITQLGNIFRVLIHNRDRLSTFHDVFFLFSTGFGGMVFYGGLLGALLAIYIYCKSQYLDFRTYANGLIPAFPLFHAFGRVGCFLSGCCYGTECKYGFTYKDSLVEEANNINRFPVQLLEAVLVLILFFILTIMLKKYDNKYSLTSIYLLLYGIIRFFNEFLRGDIIRGFLGPFSTSQWISLIIIAVISYRHLRNEKN